MACARTELRRDDSDRGAGASGRESPGSGRESLGGPAAGRLPAVPESVVHPVDPAVPELGDLRLDPVAAPEVRHRHRRPLGPALTQFAITVVKLGARADDRGLPAGPGAELRPARPRAEVGFAVGRG